MSAAQHEPGTTTGTEHRERRAALWVGRALTYVVYAYVLVTEIILALGFVLLLFGANPAPSFVAWVYRSMDRAMEPFRGIFTPIDLGTSGGNDVESVLDTSVLFAMIIYAIVALALRALLDWLTSRIARIDETERERRRLQAMRQPGAPSFGTEPGTGPVDPPYGRH